VRGEQLPPRRPSRTPPSPRRPPEPLLREFVLQQDIIWPLPHTALPRGPTVGSTGSFLGGMAAEATGASSSQPQGSGTEAGAAMAREARPKMAVIVLNFIFDEI
jgi:hypothetical protein